jgi:hypothetical protein
VYYSVVIRPLSVVICQLSVIRSDDLAATLDDYRWLVSEAAAWLELARDEARRRDSVGLVVRLRKELSAERAHLVVEQVALRERAQEKFALAERMFFTRKGLEQATDERLAAYKAARFPAGQPCADLCCGIGGDLVALALRSEATGLDVDPAVRLLAESNARAHGLSESQCRVVVEDAAATPITGDGAWHCDPDRRAEGKRTTRAQAFAPALDVLDRLLADNPNAAIKLAPATEAPSAWTEAAELEWLGTRGECRQQVAWFGSLARHPGKRAATIVEEAGPARTVVGSAADSLPLAAGIGRYVYEPHSAVLAAKVANTLCREHDLAAISAGIAYLTGDRLIADAALAAFEVTDVLPLDRKQLKAYCRQHGIGRLEVKKRGVDVDPARLRQEIIGTGENEATLLVSPVAGQTRAIFTRRVV